MYYVFETLLGGPYATAKSNGHNNGGGARQSSAGCGVLPPGRTEETDEEETSNSTSIESVASSSPLSEADTSEDHQWKPSTGVRKLNPATNNRPFSLPETRNNSLEEQMLLSLGYTTPKDWPKSERTVRITKPNLYELLSELIAKSLKTNTVVAIGKSTLPVHLIVLQCFSGIFCDMSIESVSVELPTEWVTPRAFRLIYEWMIEDAPRLSRLGLLEVLRASSFLRIPQLEKQCEHCLAQGITEDSAVLLYLEARLLRMERAHRPLLQRVGRFFLTLVASQEFLQLPMHALWQLLSSNGISVNSELEVFMAAVRWLNFQWPKRRHIIAQIASCVRFSLVPPWLLIRLHDRHTNPELKRITSQPAVLQQLHDGISYTTTRLCYGADRDSFMLHLERTGLQPPMQRNWIYDRACSYHHRLHCTIVEELTYEAFVDYLIWLQEQPKDYWQSLEPVDTSELCLCCQAAEKKQKDSTPN